MTDAALHKLAKRAGIAVQWRDFAGRPRQVATGTLRAILDAMNLPCVSPNDLEESLRSLEAQETPALLTTTIGRTLHLPYAKAYRHKAQIKFENGDVADVEAKPEGHGISLPPFQEIGYHQIEIGNESIAIAAAPLRCTMVSDIAPSERIWGLAAQVYGLRSARDCGIGDMAGVVALGEAAANLGADVLALSPLHALFPSDPSHFSPYSPSSRTFYNPLHADVASILDGSWAAKLRREVDADDSASGNGLIDWPRSSQKKLTFFRRLFVAFSQGSTDVAAALKEFEEFRTARGAPLTEHALFEALQAARLQSGNGTNWQNWPAQWRDPNSPAVQDFAAVNRGDIEFHAFLQWIADRSLGDAQKRVTQAGMRVGLLADFAVGMDPAGSAVWSRQEDVLVGLQIGAPPDMLNANGQNWGLTTFSPRALTKSGYAPFLAPLRACLRHAGGVRIDHAMGLMRLWVVPDGAQASEGAYLSYPLDDLLRLIALESARRNAIVIGEDLGTVPTGFRERLTSAGIYGMSVLWFEKTSKGFAPPRRWPTASAAMTSTHDLPTVAGWWREQDLTVRSETGRLADAAGEKKTRHTDRSALWRAFRAAKVAGDEVPPSSDEAAVVAEAAVGFLARTPSQLTLLPLEDALGLTDQPNLPGTIDEHPNWRRRYIGPAADLLDDPSVQQRLRPLTERKAQ
jgi:4-alpha-glucanotransferase